MALTREDLDAAWDSNAGCSAGLGVLHLRPGCPGAGLVVCYDKRTGRLSVVCSECSGLVAEIAVARSELVQ